MSREPDGRPVPIPVEAFLQGAYLDRADIVLCRGKTNWFAKLIEWGTRSAFSHAALVFVVPQGETGFRNTFVIESVTRGVDLTDLRHYVVERQKDYDVAVLRLERDWLTDDIKRLVRGYMLDYIQADYDYGTIWKLARRIVRTIVFGVKARRHGMKHAVAEFRRRRKLVPGSFICSGFVQYGYYTAIDTLVQKGELPRERLAEVAFAAGSRPPVRTVDLISTTPEDIAACTRLRWKYVITAGNAYAVSGPQEAYELLGWRPR